MNSSVFPFPFETHLTFAIICAVFFVLQYIRLKFAYQLIMAFAVPLSLLIYVSSNKIFFYSIGLLELILLLACAVTVSSARRKSEAKHLLDETIAEFGDENAPANDNFHPMGFISSNVDTPSTDTKTSSWLEGLAGELENSADISVDDNLDSEKPSSAGWVERNYKE